MNILYVLSFYYFYFIILAKVNWIVRVQFGIINNIVADIFLKFCVPC